MVVVLVAVGPEHGLGVGERQPATRPLERDLERVLLDLADFPLLTTLVERRRDGQGWLPIGRTSRALPEVHAATVAPAAVVDIELPAPLDAAT